MQGIHPLFSKLTRRELLDKVLVPYLLNLENFRGACVRSGWPSGVRRQTQLKVKILYNQNSSEYSGGVVSNPTPDILDLSFKHVLTPFAFNHSFTLHLMLSC